MNRYLCKCGRAVNKSTNADNTGNRETEGCEGCPYLMPWGPTEWDHTRHAMVTDVKGYECRMSPTLEYRTELRGHLDDKTTIRITSLDFDFLECVSDWVKEHYPNGELSGGFSRDRIRPAEYVDEGRYRYTLAVFCRRCGYWFCWYCIGFHVPCTHSNPCAYAHRSVGYGQGCRQRGV